VVDAAGDQRRRGHHRCAEQGGRPGGDRGQAPRLPLPARTSLPDLDQNQEHSSNLGRHLRLDPGEGNRAGQIGSLLLGVYGDNGFEYAGHVGTGFTQAALARLQKLLEPLRIDQSPLDTPVPRAHAKGAVWLQPVTVAEVDFTECTKAGALRHPSFKGIRDDYDPMKVTRD